MKTLSYSTIAFGDHASKGFAFGNGLVSLLILITPGDGQPSFKWKSCGVGATNQVSLSLDNPSIFFDLVLSLLTSIWQYYGVFSVASWSIFLVTEVKGPYFKSHGLSFISSYPDRNSGNLSSHRNLLQRC